MKVRSKEIAEKLRVFGWAHLGEVKVVTVVGIYDEGDSRCSMHDWYYGPRVVRKSIPAVRVRRPEGVTRKQESQVMKCLITWDKYLKLADAERDEDLAMALAQIALKALMAAGKIAAR